MDNEEQGTKAPPLRLVKAFNYETADPKVLQSRLNALCRIGERVLREEAAISAPLAEAIHLLGELLWDKRINIDDEDRKIIWDAYGKLNELRNRMEDDLDRAQV